MKDVLPPNMQYDFPQEHLAYQQKMEAQLARWRADIIMLEAQLKEAPTNDRIAFQDQLTALKTKLQNAEERLDKMKETTGDAWAELQTDIDEMWQDMGHSVDQAKNNFPEKVGS